MSTVGEHIAITDAAICLNNGVLSDQRQLLSQNILSQLRNLVEGTAARLQAGTSEAVYDWLASHRAGHELHQGQGEPLALCDKGHLLSLRCLIRSRKLQEVAS